MQEWVGLSATYGAEEIGAVIHYRLQAGLIVGVVGEDLPTPFQVCNRQMIRMAMLLCS